MRTMKAMCAIFTAALLAGGATGQDKDLARQLKELQLKFDELAAKVGDTGASNRGFLSLLGEHINLEGRLEFEVYGAQPENIPTYASGIVGKIKGSDMRVDSLTLGTTVKFIEDVYLKAKIQVQGGNEDKAMTADEYEFYMPELYFGFDNILTHLAGLDDPLHHRVQMGSILPWQHTMFPRHTESYGLGQTMFYRDSRVGIVIGGQTSSDYGFSYNICFDDGSDLAVGHAGDNHLGYAQILSDDEGNARMSHHKDLELGLGFQKEWSNNVEVKLAGWYRIGKLTSGDRAVLAATPLGLGNLDGSHKKRRLGFIAACSMGCQWGDLELQGEFHDAYDANLHRQAIAIQPSIHFAFDGNIFNGRKFFTGMRALYRFSNMDYYGSATTSHSVPVTQLAGADMKLHTFGLVIDVTRGIDLKLEYNHFQQDTRTNVDADEYLLHLGVEF